MEQKYLFASVKKQFRYALGLSAFLIVFLGAAYFTKNKIVKLEVRSTALAKDWYHSFKLRDGNTFTQEIGELYWKPKNIKEIFLVMIADQQGICIDLFYMFIIAICVNLCLYKIDETNIFESKNHRKIFISAALILSYPLFLVYFKGLIQRLAIESLTNNQFTNAREPGTALAFQVWFFMVLFFAYFFYKAKSLQQENDLTI